MKDKLVFNYLVDERRYELKTSSGELVENVVKKFIEEHDLDIQITNEDEYKVVWANRTEINNLKNSIASARKQTTAVVINPLANACKPLEKMLEEVSDKLTEKLNAFKPKEPFKPTTTIITIEYPIDSEEIKKVKTYLNRVKIAYKEEEK